MRTKSGVASSPNRERMATWSAAGAALGWALMLAGGFAILYAGPRASHGWPERSIMLGMVFGPMLVLAAETLRRR